MDSKANCCLRFFSTIVLLLLAIFSQGVFSYDEEQLNDTVNQGEINPFIRKASLEPQGRVFLEWAVNWKESRVTFNLTTATLGWVGFGMSKTGKMRGASIIIGGVEPNETVYFNDIRVVFDKLGGRTPVQTENKDWILHNAWENSTHTFMSFSRAFRGDGGLIENPITDDGTKFIWAFGYSDVIGYHGPNRGSFPIYLRDPDYTPDLVRDLERNDEQTETVHSWNNETNVKVWSIKSTLQFPTKRTTYWCNIHKLQLNQKHHIIGYKVYVNPEVQQNVQKLLVFRCHSPPGVNSSSIYEPFLNHPGEECYSQDDNTGTIPTQNCVEIKLVHGNGGLPVFFPGHFGIPVGESDDQNEYFLLQTHYENPNHLENLNADIQMDVYYTENIRANDGGILNVGQSIPGPVIIPPGEQSHRLYGHCSSSCTGSLIPPEGIKVVGAVSHTHLNGKRIRIQQFRNNKELPWILNDDNYDPSYQPVRFSREESVILPSDQVSVQCYYDTTGKSNTTVTGFGSDQETCQAFIFYYNRLEGFDFCKSSLESEEYIRRYLAGTFNLSWDHSELEYRSDDATTAEVIGMKLSEISDSPHVNWTTTLRSMLRRDHIILPQVSICPNTTLQSEFVSYPVEATPYQLPEYCSKS